MKYILTCEFDSINELCSFVNVNDTNIVKKDPNDYSTPHRSNKPLTQIELDYIKDHYLSMKSKHIGKALGRTHGSIVQVLNLMYKKGLHKKQHRAKNI